MLARKKREISIVVDTSVLQAAGGPGRPNLVSKNCTEALMTIKKDFFVACTQDLFGEWLSHKARLSYFSSMWLVDMRLKGCLNVVPPPPGLRERLEKCLTDKFGSGVGSLRDIHLIESAVASDNRIVSRDNTAYIHFATCCDAVPELHDILWANPEDKDTLQWLKDSAPKNKDFLLCSV